MKPGLINKYPITAFIILAFFISHILNPVIVELVHILLPRFSFSFPEAGLNERSLVNQYGASFAALIIVLRLYGIRGLLSMLSFNKINKDAIFWLAFSIMIPLIMILISYSLAGVSLITLINILQDDWPFYLLIIVGFIISAGLAEEFGWRGFLLPQLLKTQSPLLATCIIFLIVSLWHFPALIAGWKGEPIWPWLILSFAVAIIHSWLFFMSKGNLIVVIIFHACFDAQYSFYSHFIADKTVPHIPFHQGWIYVMLYFILALAVIIITKGNLGCNSKNLDTVKYFDNHTTQ